MAPNRSSVVALLCLSVVCFCLFFIFSWVLKRLFILALLFSGLAWPCVTIFFDVQACEIVASWKGTTASRLAEIEKYTKIYQASGLGWVMVSIWGCQIRLKFLYSLVLFGLSLPGVNGSCFHAAWRLCRNVVTRRAPLCFCHWDLSPVALGCIV